ncbi:hypothetical protein AAK894_10450 [Lachnospiraceae bacterium 46-61]
MSRDSRESLLFCVQNSIHHLTMLHRADEPGVMGEKEWQKKSARKIFKKREMQEWQGIVRKNKK